MSLLEIIIWLAIAGMMMLVGTVLTIRRSRDNQRDHVWVGDVVGRMRVIACSYCQCMTTQCIGVTHDGRTYSPVCLDCQYRTGIRCPDGTISAEYFYQVEPCA